MLFTDTDSLVYEIGLKSKMYYLVTVDGEEVKEAKNINKNVVERVRHKEYVNVLFGRGLVRHSIELKVMFVKFLCSVLMISVIFL